MGDMDKVAIDKTVTDKPDTAIKMITTMTTGVKIMGMKNNLMEDTRKRIMNMNKIDMTIMVKITDICNHLMEGTKRNPDMDKLDMDKLDTDNPNTEKPNMEKRAMIRPGPWHKTPFY